MTPDPRVRYQRTRKRFFDTLWAQPRDYSEWLIVKVLLRVYLGGMTEEMSQPLRESRTMPR